MLGRKVPGSGVLSAGAGMDRGRTGERLHAALAGLQELHFLRDKQSAMVHWALTLNRDQPDPSKQENVSKEELKLEATLSLLKQQLVRHQILIKDINITIYQRTCTSNGNILSQTCYTGGEL